MYTIYCQVFSVFLSFLYHNLCLSSIPLNQNIVHLLITPQQWICTKQNFIAQLVSRNANISTIGKKTLQTRKKAESIFLDLKPFCAQIPYSKKKIWKTKMKIRKILPKSPLSEVSCIFSVLIFSLEN